MKVLQINATYGVGSTGKIVQDIVTCCEAHGIEGYVAYSNSNMPATEITNSYKIGNTLSEKWHAVLSRLGGQQAYFNRFTTWLFLRYLDSIKPDIVHLHNLHSNYIHLNMLLNYLAKHDIATVITMHDCWYFTGGCFHYTNAGCNKWQYSCGDCPKRRDDTPAYLFDSTRKILQDREKYLTAIPRLYLVGCSQWVADEAQKSVLKHCNIRYLYNGFDLDIYKPSKSDLTQRLGVEGKHVLLGPASKWLSSVNKRTLDYFTKNMPDDYVLLLFGYMGVGQTLTNNVLLYGYTSSREEMAQLYSMADVFVNCSREDTLSSLNLEAQACGTPVVTYEATGSKETVDGQCGFALETGNAESLWIKTKEVVEQGKAFFSESCINFISERFNKVDNYNKYIQLYHEIMEGLFVLPSLRNK